MKLCIYGTKEDQDMFLTTINELDSLVFRQIEIDLVNNFDDLIKAANQNTYDVVVIMKDNADGMEGVIAVKSILPNKPVIWFSNDKDFGAQSYRLNTAYFHEKPVNTTILNQAFEKCRLQLN